MPIGRGIANPRYDFLDPRPSRSLAVPTLLDQLPQGVGDPDSRCIRRFLRANARGDAVRELQGFDIMEWFFACQDLTECQERQVDGSDTRRVPGE